MCSFHQLINLFRNKAFQIALVLAFLSISLLTNDLMGWNETDVLPLARQYADPSWVSTDWYLNQAPGYRLLFQSIFGWMAATWGLLATALIGRLVSYALFAVGLVLLAQKLGLNLPLLLLAIALFFQGGCTTEAAWCDFRQGGVIAGEWMIGGLEAKAIAYGLLLLALRWLLDGRYLRMALALGLATSFHVLVGGWAFVTALGWLFLHQGQHRLKLKQWAAILLVYGLGSIFAFKPILHQLLQPSPESNLPPSFIYVFLRLPHHLNPLSWSPEQWLRPALVLLILLLSIGILIWFQFNSLSSSSPSDRSRNLYQARMGLAQFTLLTLVPFGIGLAIAPFDTEGKWLQYYPFRLGDAMLPLGTCLLSMCALRQAFTGKHQRKLILASLVILGFVFYPSVSAFAAQAQSLPQFPNEKQQVASDWKDFSTWIRQHTPRRAIFVSPPRELVNFTWLTERATIAKFKLLPQTSAGIVEWYQRLNDLSGNALPQRIDQVDRTQNNRLELERQSTQGYNHLTTAQAKALMKKYQATYFVTRRNHQLDLPIAYCNSGYVLYSLEEG